MRVHVDLELCDSHGQCVFAAPAVFNLDDVGQLHYEPKPPEAELPAVERAVRLCLVRAVTLEK